MSIAGEGTCPVCGDLRRTFLHRGEEILESHGPPGVMCPGTHTAPKLGSRLWRALANFYHLADGSMMYVALYGHEDYPRFEEHR